MARLIKVFLMAFACCVSAVYTSGFNLPARTMHPPKDGQYYYCSTSPCVSFTYTDGSFGHVLYVRNYCNGVRWIESTKDTSTVQWYKNKGGSCGYQGESHGWNDWIKI